MTRVVWSEDLSVGIDVIDKQHKRIVDYINELDDAIESEGADRLQRIGHVVDSAIDYTESHFGFEEVMLEGVDYPFLKAHKRVHDLFVKRVVDYRDRLKVGEDISLELRNTLSRWLINHIKNEDADYAKWFTQPGEGTSAGGKAAKVDDKRKLARDHGWLGERLRRFFRG